MKDREPVEFRASPAESGERIDVALARHAGITRTQAQRSLRAGLVVVDGEIVRPSHRLEQGQLVVGHAAQAAVGTPVAEDIPISVRHSDDRVLVVSKPPGMVTHPAAGHERGTLVNALLGLGIPLAGRTSVRPGIVHRLDKDTSGLLLVAKDDAARDFLVAALQEREVERRYVALVRGAPASATGTIDAPIGRHPNKRTAMAVVGSGRPAVTHYRLLEEAGDVALLDVGLETGRTHQIRVHLSHLGHPVVGDRAYGGMGEPARLIGLERPFLHAWKLTFPHPDGGMIQVVDPLPDDLAAALATAGIARPGSI